MLFNSFEFIFLFLPLTVSIYYALMKKASANIALAFLLFASFFFYGYWNSSYLALIITSILCNYFLGRKIGKTTTKIRKTWLVTGITFNLGLLAYFKYFNFFIVNINTAFDTGWNTEKIILPLAISFFTFQQISYLVDSYKQECKEYNLLHYSLFVCFFPQLIAGPIVHHKEMLPQFFKKENLSPKLINFAIGISIFALGFFKKTVIADSLSEYVTPTFDATDTVDLIQAWSSALAYTFQLYFDFSGYSDMAIGCARMFGIILPVNFFSPYKSTSIVEFWRRWHITLSRFLRDYLYISLGGNKNGLLHRYRNLFLTMLLGGLWHGAGWTFIIWGVLHGIFLVINHMWKWGLRTLNLVPRSGIYITLSWLTTFVAVVFSWVYFRSPTLDRANEIVFAMLGKNGAIIPSGVAYRLGDLRDLLIDMGFRVGEGSGSMLMGSTVLILMAALITLLMPNSSQIFSKSNGVLFEKKDAFPLKDTVVKAAWKPNLFWSLATAILLAVSVLTLGQISEFLYFQF